MEPTYKTLFDRLKKDTPSNDLSSRITLRVQMYEEQRIRTQKTIWAGAGFFSSVGTIALSLYTYNHLLSSGFYQYVSLIFSEQASLATYAKDFGAVLLESLPVVGTGALLLTLAILMWSIKSFTESQKHIHAFA